MKVQRILIPPDPDKPGENPKVAWLVLGDDYRPIEAVREYLRYLAIAGSSPCTIRSYAYHLLLFFRYLAWKKLDWKAVKFEDFIDFISWLRLPPLAPQIIRFPQAGEPVRSDKTINTIVAAVVSFYEYQERLEKVEAPIFHDYRKPYGNPTYKPFLHHISKGEPQKRSLLKIKTPKMKPPTLTAEEVSQIVSVCQRLRDRFLVCTLAETGMRIGQALGLRHGDIRSFDNVIKIVPRDDNVNGARAKTDTEYQVHVSRDLMKLYADYLIEEYGEIDSDYVFVNLWENPVGKPYSYGAAKDLFNRLGRITGIDVHPHIFRHTHATDLIRSGVDESHVQKRLGHKSILTTINIYAHVSQEDLKVAYRDYLDHRETAKQKKEKKQNAK